MVMSTPRIAMPLGGVKAMSYGTITVQYMTANSDVLRQETKSRTQNRRTLDQCILTQICDHTAHTFPTAT